MASASSSGSNQLESHALSASNSLAVLQQIANSAGLDEISNSSGAVRHHIYCFSNRNKDNTLHQPLLFIIYQTGRHGPQNGFRLCIVHRGFHIASATKAKEDVEDDVDSLEKEIPQGHMEVVFLGPKPSPPPSESEEDCNIIFRES